MGEKPYLRRLAAASAIQPAEELRALWVVRDVLASRESIDRCIDFAVRVRAQLLFVQVRGRGDAYYASEIAPVPSDLTAPIREFDPLAYLLVRAHQNGVSVHAWMNVYYVWSNPHLSPGKGHVANEHPEWLATNAAGVRMDERPVRSWQAAGIEGYYVSPWMPSYRERMAGVVEELVSRYDVDGIHLDYIRFPSDELGFESGARTSFQLMWGIDPADLVGRRRDVDDLLGSRAAAVVDSAWVRERAAAVDSMVVAIRTASGSMPLSAAVVADPDAAIVRKGQNWTEWVHKDWVDFVVPMAYNVHPRTALDWVRRVHNAVGRDHVVVGLAVHGGRDGSLARMINLLRIDGTRGFAIFSYNVLSERRFATKFLNDVFSPPERVEDPAPDMP